MVFLDRVFCVLIFFSIIGCEYFKPIENNKSSNQLEGTRELNLIEAQNLEGVYDINVNEKFLKKIDKIGEHEIKYFNNCAFFDSSNHKFIIKLTKESPEFVFLVRYLKPEVLVFYNKDNFFQVDQIDQGGNYKLLFQYQDEKGNKSKNLATPIDINSLESCLERQEEIYESEKQFVEQQNNDGE